MNKSIYSTFKRKIIILTLLISFVPLALIFFSLYYGFSKAYNQKIEQQIVSRTMACAQSLNIFIEERQVILSTIAKAGSLSYYNDQDHLRQLFININAQTGGGLIDIGVIDSNGDHLAYVGPYDLKGLNYKEQPWFDHVMIRGVFISDVFMGYRDFPHFIIAVKARDNEQNWVLRATIDPEIFVNLIRTAQTGKTGDAFVINQKGFYQSPPRFYQKKILDESGIDTSKFGSGVSVVKDCESFGEGIVCSGMWVKNREWLLVVNQKLNETIFSFNGMKIENILIFFLAVLGIVVTTIVTTKFSVDKLQERDKELDEMNAQLIQTDKMAALGKMAAGVAHEINNPLGIISTKAGWIQDLLEEEEFKDSENYQEYIDALLKIEENVERAGKVTHNMLGFARAMEPAMEKISLNDVLNNTIEFLNHHAQINNIKISKEYDSLIPEFQSDRSQLQQVFLNIINNAIDAIDKQGEIRIKTYKKSDMAVVEIMDTGKGIPENMMNKIFNPFFTTKEVNKGTGLGLSITYKIIEKLGGHISVRSKVNKGTTFTITLPIRIKNR